MYVFLHVVRSLCSPFVMYAVRYFSSTLCLRLCFYFFVVRYVVSYLGVSLVRYVSL